MVRMVFDHEVPVFCRFALIVLNAAWLELNFGKSVLPASRPQLSACAQFADSTLKCRRCPSVNELVVGRTRLLMTLVLTCYIDTRWDYPKI